MKAIPTIKGEETDHEREEGVWRKKEPHEMEKKGD